MYAYNFSTCVRVPVSHHSCTSPEKEKQNVINITLCTIVVLSNNGVTAFYH